MHIQSLIESMTRHRGRLQSAATETGNSQAGTRDLEATLRTTTIIANLQNRLQTVLPKDLQRRLFVSLTRSRHVCLLALDSVALAQARMMLPDIQEALRAAYSDQALQSQGIGTDATLRIKVMPKNPSQAIRLKPPRPLSMETGEALCALAQHCEDPELVRILKKLASHAS